MAAYAAVVSLINTITMEQIPHHTRHFDSAETVMMEHLSETAAFLQEFLEGEWKGAKDLEGRIADAAHAAENAIESLIVDEVRFGSRMGSDPLCWLKKAIKGMDSIMNEAMQVKENSGVKLQDIQSLTSAASLRSPPIQRNRMVGLQDEKTRVMEELASNSSSRQVIPIVGMGGSGKTTLARNIYDDKFTVQHFDICAWVTVSQEYNVEEILKGVLSNLKKQSITDNENLQVQVHQYLSGRRYLIVLDDIWSLDCWDQVHRFFPDSNQGSRIMITTRLSNLAKQITSNSIDMKLLDDDSSWKLFCEEVFGEESCPPELEVIGEEIVQKCRGLPLALVVTGGHLKNSSMTVEYWNRVAEDLRSTVTSNANDICLEILQSSYNYLSIHLKPCFLYMGVFPEDHEIRVSKLCKVWIAEGFLKPSRGKSSEEVARSFLLDLIERNLILVDKLGLTGKIKYCKIHDLLRDLSLREALKEKFLFVIGAHNLDVPPIMCGARRIVLDDTLRQSEDPLPYSLKSALLARSVAYNNLMPIIGSSLLWVSNPVGYEYNCPLEDPLQFVNLRYLDFRIDRNRNFEFPSTICHLRNLQTLIVEEGHATVIPPDIWDMRQLTHVKFSKIVLPDPGSDDLGDSIILENLRTLENVENFRCSKEVVKKISNIKKLKITLKTYEEQSYNSLQNLKCLEKLDSLDCSFPSYTSNQNVLLHTAFPRSLRKLVLHGGKLLWEDMTELGLLRHLEVLKLHAVSFEGPDWNPEEEQFARLKYLSISSNDLVNWNAESSHFPCLEQLVLFDMKQLKEIPVDFEDLSTLRLIQLLCCAYSVAISAKKIQEAQESLGNADLQVEVHYGLDQLDWLEEGAMIEPREWNLKVYRFEELESESFHVSKLNSNLL